VKRIRRSIEAARKVSTRQRNESNRWCRESASGFLATVTAIPIAFAAIVIWSLTALVESAHQPSSAADEHLAIVRSASGAPVPPALPPRPVTVAPAGVVGRTDAAGASDANPGSWCSANAGCLQH